MLENELLFKLPSLSYLAAAAGADDHRHGGTTAHLQDLPAWLPALLGRGTLLSSPCFWGGVTSR